MLSKKMEKALNDQMVFELYSGYIYLSISSWFKTQELPGFANWFRVQAQEELVHGMKFFDYILEVGGHAKTGAIQEPPLTFKSTRAACELALEHERIVTSNINKLVTMARKEDDHATDNFLQWFITEQIEEEANATSNVARVKMVENDGRGILMLDAEMAKRVFVPPAAPAAA